MESKINSAIDKTSVRRFYQWFISVDAILQWAREPQDPDNGNMKVVCLDEDAEDKYFENEFYPAFCRGEHDEDFGHWAEMSVSEFYSKQVIGQHIFSSCESIMNIHNKLFRNHSLIQ